MIRNPICCGRISIPAYNEEKAHYVKRVHETLISEEVFHNVQDILNGKKRMTVASNKQKDELPLRGFLTCTKCGGQLTGSTSKGKYQHYFYYHCQPGCKERFRADDANDKLVAKLQENAAKKETLNFYHLMLEKQLKKSSKENTGNKQNVIAEIKKNQEWIDNAQKLMLDGQLDITEYRSIKQKFEVVIKELEAETKPQVSNTKDYKQYIEFGFNLLQNIDGVYVSGNTQLKSQILSSILAEKLVFEEKSYRTLVYHEALALILNTSKGLAEIRKDKLPVKAIYPLW